jgi:hypothetical protein
MNRFVPNNKYVVFCLLLVVFGVAVAIGVTRADASTSAPPPVGPDVGEALKLQRRAIAAAEDQMAEEAYEKRNAEITPWVEDGAHPNPDNAALMYYQAFLLRPEPNEAIKYKMHPSIEPDRQVRTYLGHCLPVIEIVEIASRIPQCTWGVGYARGLTRRILRREMGYIVDILLVDAKTLAVDGHCRVALERCLTLRRFARHLSEDPELYLYSIAWDQKALNTIRQVLGVMSPDADILTWFRGQFAVAQGSRLSVNGRVLAEVKDELKNIRTNPNFYKNPVIDMVEDEKAKENARNLTDEQLLLRFGEGFQRVIDPILRILDSEMTYEQKRSEMRRLVDEMKEADGTDSIEKAIISLSVMKIEGIIDYGYSSHIGHQAHINGIRAAVEVYLVVAKTGNLPEKLPDYLPKDPFNGKDFLYKITDEGFALRCQGKIVRGRENQWLEFKVRK